MIYKITDIDSKSYDVACFMVHTIIFFYLVPFSYNGNHYGELMINPV